MGDEGPDDSDKSVPDALVGRSPETLVLNASQVTVLLSDVDDIQKKQTAIFRILNNPKPTAAQRAVDLILGDWRKMALAVFFVLGVGAITTGTFMSYTDEGFQIGVADKVRDASSLGAKPAP